MLSILIFLLIGISTSFDESGNYLDEGTNEPSPKIHVTLNEINDMLREFSNDVFNVTFQLEFVRAIEAVDRGRLELTVWAHEVWTIPELARENKLWDHRDSVKLLLDSQSQLKFVPETVFKNALYFKEHRTPLLNSVLQVNKHGYVSLHSLYTLDVPCTKIIPTRSKCIKYDLCGMEIKEGQYLNGIGAVCELYYGSLTRDKTQLNLNWAFNNFGESNMPCSVEFMPRCVITRIRPSKKEVTFLGEEYDELVACIVLAFPGKEF